MQASARWHCRGGGVRAGPQPPPRSFRDRLQRLMLLVLLLELLLLL
jgi:hypothetical protein